jgi:hypothetical protein
VDRVSTVRASRAFLYWTAGRSAGRRASWAALETALATTTLVLAWLVLPQVFLPALSLAALAASAVVALFVRRLETFAGHAGIASRDVAGGLAFLGFAAGMLSKPEQVLQLFGHTPMIN